MRKNFKKIVAGAFVGLFALQTVIAMPASAQTTVLGTFKYTGPAAYNNIYLKCYKNFNFIPSDYYIGLDLDSCNFSTGTMVYDLTDYASTKSDVTGNQNWTFAVKILDRKAETLENITLKDNLGNVIKTTAVNRTLSINSDELFNVETNLVNYDLNYDGDVTLDDARLANQMVYTITPSDLQVVLGDSNNNGYIDLTDVNKILNVALGIA